LQTRCPHGSCDQALLCNVANPRAVHGLTSFLVWFFLGFPCSRRKLPTIRDGGLTPSRLKPGCPRSRASQRAGRTQWRGSQSGHRADASFRKRLPSDLIEGSACPTFGGAGFGSARGRRNGGNRLRSESASMDCEDGTNMYAGCAFAAAWCFVLCAVTSGVPFVRNDTGSYGADFSLAAARRHHLLSVELFSF